jgi:hypothetical protein
MNADLAAFVEHARQKGLDHATIRLMLLAAGWKEKEVVEALARTSLDVPIPAPPDRGGAREAFFHLLMFASFYATVIAGLSLLLRYIDRLLADAAERHRFGSEAWELSAIRWSLAFLIVSFPLYLLLSRLLLREMRAHPERSWSVVRRWLTYLTLFLASLALAGDVIALVFRLLEGELTARFLLKVLAVSIVAGLSFTYYLLSLRLPAAGPGATRLHRSFGGAAGALVLVTLVWGFVLAGSPAVERVRKLDERRIEDLQAIHDEIVNLSLGDARAEPPDERRLQRPLPRTLEELAQSARHRRPDIVDPETGEPYEYIVLDETRFRLCATFRLERNEKSEPVWNHASGRHCFELDALRPD